MRLGSLFVASLALSSPMASGVPPLDTGQLVTTTTTVDRGVETTSPPGNRKERRAWVSAEHG